HNTTHNLSRSPSKTRHTTWWNNPCWQAQMSDVSCSWSPGLYTSQEGFWSTQKSLRLRIQWEGMRFKPNILRYMAPSIVPSMQWSRPVPLAEKQPQSIMFPPPCLTVGMLFLGSYSAFFPLQTR